MSATEKAERGNRLRAFRERLKETEDARLWSQAAVADRAEIERPNYVAMEVGRSAFTGGSLWKLAIVYGLEPKDLSRLVGGALPMEDAVQLRAERNPFASEVLPKIEGNKALRATLREHPRRWRISTVVRAVMHETYVRANEAEPEIGWISLLDAVERGDIDRETARGPAAAREHARRTPERPLIVGFTQKAKSKRRV